MKESISSKFSLDVILKSSLWIGNCKLEISYLEWPFLAAVAISPCMHNLTTVYESTH